MRRIGFALTLAVLAGIGVFSGGAAEAQAPGPNVQRDCQTVRTCNFNRTGAVRGCLSSFSCRACKPVTVRCNLSGGGACQALRCDWGG